jgi:hypothetical protein
MGASDPVSPGALPTLEQWADSIAAVLDDLGSGEAGLLAVDSVRASGAFAATHPFLGAHKLKGVPGDWHLFAVTSTS